MKKNVEDIIPRSEFQRMTYLLLKRGFVYDDEDNIWYDEHPIRLKYNLRIHIVKVGTLCYAVVVNKQHDGRPTANCFNAERLDQSILEQVLRDIWDT